MKNTKLIGLVALLVVVVLVVSVVIATSADNDLVKGVNASLKTYEQKIADLEAKLEKLGVSLDKANDLLAALEKNNINATDFDKLSEDVYKTWAELNTTFGDAKKNANQDLYFNYDAKVDAIKNLAEYQIFRATSTTALAEIKAAVLAQLNAIPTKVEEYATVVDAILEGGVTLEDAENIGLVIAGDMTNYAADLYAGETDEDKTAAKDALDAKYFEAYAQYVAAHVAAFNAKVAALPSATAIVLDNKAAVVEARNYYDDIVDLYAQYLEEGTEPEYTEGFVADEVTLADLEDIVALYETIKTEVDTFNATLVIDGDLTLESINDVQGLETALAEKIAYIAETYNVVLTEGELNFNAYVLSFFDPENKVEGYRSAYNTLRADYEKLVAAYKTAVQTLTEQTTYAELVKANKAAHTAWSNIADKFNEEFDAADLDTYLELTENTVDATKSLHSEISDELELLGNKITAIKNGLAETADKSFASLKTLVEEYLLDAITTDRKFTEEVIGAELLAELKTAFVAAINEKVKDAFDAWKTAGQAAMPSGETFTVGGAEQAMNAKLATVTVETLKFVAGTNEDGTFTGDWSQDLLDLYDNVDTWSSDVFFNNNK